MYVARRMVRSSAAALLLGLSAATSAQPAVSLSAAVPAVLTEPALQSPKAIGAATLSITRAGRRLVAVGERGTVLLSDDAGTTWRQAKVPVQVTLTAVRFVDDRTGWAVGHLGVILKSTDGGETWTKQLDGVSAAKAIAEAVLASADERAQREAKRFVEEGPDKPFFDLDFIDARRGFAVGAYNLAFATTDGGATWEPILSRLPNPKSLHLYGVRAASGRVHIVGEQGLLLTSDDGGSSFSVRPAPYKGSLFGLLMARTGTLLAYGLRGNALRSVDQGVSWVKVDTGTSVSISAAVELDGGALVLLGQTGALQLSRDDGQSFTKTLAAVEPVPATSLTTGDGGQLVLASLRGMRRQAVNPLIQ